MAMKKSRSPEQEKFLRGCSYHDEGHDREMERRLSLRVAALNSAAPRPLRLLVTSPGLALFSLWTGVI
jgi:hypothetical protein